MFVTIRLSPAAIASTAPTDTSLYVSTASTYFTSDSGQYSMVGRRSSVK